MPREELKRIGRGSRLSIPFCAVLPTVQPSGMAAMGMGSDHSSKPPAPSLTPRALAAGPAPTLQLPGKRGFARRAGQCRPSGALPVVSASSARTSCVACLCGFEEVKAAQGLGLPPPSRLSAWSTLVSEDSQVWVAWPVILTRGGHAGWWPVPLEPHPALPTEKQAFPASCPHVPGSQPLCCRQHRASQTPLPVSSLSTRVSAQR